MAEYHALRRTSPKGTAFIGTCVSCGRTNLPMSAVHEECENPAQLTSTEQLLTVMEPEDD